MNRTEDKLFENDFYNTLGSKVKIRKAAGMNAPEMIGKIRQNIKNIFPDRGSNVSFNSKRGRIDIDFYSGKRGVGDLRDSFNKVQIVIFPFDESGRQIGNHVKTQMTFNSFTKEFGAQNKSLKKMPNIQTSHEKTIREIDKWFTNNEKELKQGDAGIPKSKIKSIKAAEVTARG